VANSVGQINFGVGIDASGIAAELNAALTPALAQVQAKLNQKPLKVPIEIDTTAAIAAARTALRNANLKATAKVDLDLRITPAQQAALQQIRSLSDKTINVRFNINLSPEQIRNLRAAATAINRLESKAIRVDFSSAITETQLKLIRNAASAIRRLESKSIRVDISTNLTDDQIKALRNAASAIRRLESKTVTIRVDIQVDEARLERLAEVLRNLRDRNVRVSSSVDDSGVTRMSNALSGLSKFAGVGAGIAAGLAAIVGAAGAAAGAVGGLVAGLAAVGPAVAAIGATAVVGFQGVGDAFSALSDISANAASDARAQAEAVASAQDALTAASDQAESAQLALNDAQDAAADAANDVADAYKTAQERLDNYQTTLREASLDEREAALSLKEAQDALAKGGFTDPTDRERALLRVERAEINLQKAQKASKDLQEEATEAFEKGIDQSDEVVAARKNQAAADRAVDEAQKNLVRSNQAVARAAEDLAKAQSGAGTATEKFNDALARLAPNAQSFVLAARDLAPAWEAVRKSVQDNLFANLGDQLRETADVLLPAIQEGMGGVASELNLAAQNAFEFLRSEEGMRGLNAAFESGENLLRGLRSGTGEFTQGLVDLTATAAPRMEEIGRSIAAIGEGIGRAFSAAAESGLLDQVLSGFSQVLTSLGPLLEGVLTSFMTMAAEVLPALAPLFEQLGQSLVAIAPSLGSIGAVFLNSLTAILPTLAELITALAEGLEPVLPVIVGLLKTVGQAIQPLIEPFSRIAIILGETLINTINALAPALEPLATAFADLLQAVAPLIPLIAEQLAAVVSALAPALSEVFNALGPVIKAFAEQMTPVIHELAPILAEVGKTIGLAIADAIRQLAPLLPPLIQAWADLILAIAPLLPQLVDLAVQFLPPVISIIGDLLPVLTKVIELFTWLVQNVLIPIVMPAIEQLATQWKESFDQIAAAVNWVTDTVFPKIGEALDSVKGFFSGAVDAIGTKWAELMDKAAVPVNFVIETVWNNGLLKAWGSIDNLLGGVLPDAQPLTPIPRRATGGPIGYMHGGGNGTKDDILTWLSNGEHVVTAAEVIRAGGQNVLFAIRDMIFRGIPFTWDNGRIITDLGRDNLSAYGAAVASKGFGNVPPEGLFDQLARVPIPQFATGGPIMPWMHQLKAGHDFARAQNGKPYQWAGPRFVGDSFDCSGFMGSIIAAILGGNPWQRYWATASFAGYPQVGAQGLTKNLTEGSGMAVGITDDPGGPGGGHTAGELRGIPELGIPAARVESGGALGDVHYGRGTDPNSFASLYGLPIGANGFFAPAPGGMANAGPSVAEQDSFLRRTIERMVKAATDPVRDLITSAIGSPPPLIRGIPVAALDSSEKAFVNVAAGAVGNLGGLIGGAWQKAQDLGDRVLDFVNPFDSGGIASGTGFMPKNVIAPERVLSPEQTALFEALVVALQKIGGAAVSAAGSSVANVVVDISQASITELQDTQADARREDQAETVDAIERTASSTEAVAAQAAQEQMDQLTSIGNKLTGDVLGPIFSAAVNAGTDFLTDVIDGLSKDVVSAVNGTTRAVNELGSDTGGGGGTSTPAFGSPGSSFDFASAVSDAVVTVANAASAAFQKVADDVVNAALAQTPSRVGNQSRGRLGEDDISGGFLIDFIVKLTGVEIEILDLLENTYEEIQAFREGSVSGFDESGQLISDTAALVQRNQSSIELAAAEQERIQKALIKSVIKYLIVNVLLPIITAILGAMITLATTAIGAAIGSAIPVIGTAIGAAVGAAVGAALTGLAAVFTSLLAVGAGAALDAFDEGGVAQGLGFMPKNTIAPERVLSPRQTTAFETLVSVLDRGTSGNKTVQIGSQNFYGASGTANAAENLLSLLNT
jgi:phage-related protein